MCVCLRACVRGCVRACVCVCVCVREREGEGERESVCVCVGGSEKDLYSAALPSICYVFGCILLS